jgi:lipopolysaccharide/colanic/teichoic acid biosynthesis glycosyltransferase
MGAGGRAGYWVLKRGLDLGMALLALCLLAPVLVIIMCILRCTGEGEVFYRQRRVGFGGKPFRMWKFVTMRKDSPNFGTITAKNDPRILPFGRILRFTKLNEVPQLLNVITGDMTIVGPRPLTEETFSLYSEDVQKVIVRNRPGVTGIGSVVFRNEEEMLAKCGKALPDYVRTEIAPFKGALEKWYDQRKSLRVDLGIIILTVLAIVWPGNELHYAFFADLPRKVSQSSPRDSACD